MYTRELRFPEGERNERLGTELCTIDGVTYVSLPAGAMLPGCPFAPRCTVKVAACETTQPLLTPAGQGRRAACHLLEARP